jgi:hypothetical protein
MPQLRESNHLPVGSGALSADKGALRSSCREGGRRNGTLRSRAWREKKGAAAGAWNMRPTESRPPYELDGQRAGVGEAPVLSPRYEHFNRAMNGPRSRRELLAQTVWRLREPAKARESEASESKEGNRVEDGAINVPRDVQRGVRIVGEWSEGGSENEMWLGPEPWRQMVRGKGTEVITTERLVDV